MRNEISTLILIALCFASSAALNYHPVIGILTQPSEYQPYAAEQYSYIAASYVKFIESAGAQVVPIPYDADHATIDLIFQNINGVLFPGGSCSIDLNVPQPGSKVPYNMLTHNANYILTKAMAAYNGGDYFPIWGTCLGFELLHLVVNNFTNPLQSVTNQKYFTRNLTYDLGGSRLYDSMDANVRKFGSDVGAAFFNHVWAIYDTAYSKYPALAAFFRRTSHTFNGVNQTFVSSVEAKDYPIYGTQYHPEQNQYEWLVTPNHDAIAIEFSQSIANFFVNEARQNNHRFDQKWLDQNLIYNYQAYQVSSSFNQVYIMPNFYNQGLAISFEVFSVTLRM